MCSGTQKSVAKADLALQNAQAAMTNTLNNDYSTTFAEQQEVLKQQVARMNYIAANPMGYTPQELATQKTAINENTATAARQALGTAAAFAAAHGGADVGNGAIGEIAGEIASSAAQSKAQQLSALSTSNEQMKRQNFWSAIQGLNSASSQLGGAGGTAIGGAGSAADTSIHAGTGATEAAQSAFSEFGSIMSGVGGLVSAGSGVGGAGKVFGLG